MFFGSLFLLFYAVVFIIWFSIITRNIMKKQIITLASLLVLTACEPPRTEQTPAQNQDKNQAVSLGNVNAGKQAEATGEYAELIKLNQSLKSQLQNATATQADQLYRDHHQRVHTYVTKLNAQHANFLENYDDPKNWQDMASDPEPNEPRVPVGEMKQFIDKLAQANLMLVDSGMGVMAIQETPDYYQNLFTGKASPDVDNYIRLQAQERAPKPSEDNVVVQWKHLSERVSAWENFLQQHPNSAYQAEAKAKFNEYADLFLFGNEEMPVALNHEPILSDEVAEFAEIEKKWADYAKQHPNSKLVPMIEEAKKIARLQGGRGEERFVAQQKFRQTHFQK